MRSRILRCGACSLYTLKEICPACGGRTATTKPPRFSPDDPYGKYRRALGEMGGVLNEGDPG